MQPKERAGDKSNSGPSRIAEKSDADQKAFEWSDPKARHPMRQMPFTYWCTCRATYESNAMTRK